MSIRIDKEGPVTIVTIDRPGARNAVDPETADELIAAFEDFDSDEEACVGILTGAEGAFCAGADLKFVAAGNPPPDWIEGDGPMGPSRRLLNKPVIAAIAGHAVAGGLELALWCDLRIAEEGAILGVYCRRWGVPLIDGGTVRLPRLVGMGHALDLILTGRAVGAREALAMGLCNRITPDGASRPAAEALAHELAAFPQACLRADRRSAYGQWDLELGQALAAEARGGVAVLEAEALAGAGRFASGAGRHGSFEEL